MLSRFDDKAIDNQKIERAADLLDGVANGGKPGRRFGYTRAYGAWAWGVTYANAHLTDGLMTSRAIEKYRIGKTECDALVAVGLWHHADSGYQIHDFLDWNPSAAEVKSKQSKDRDRKRKAAGYDEADSSQPSARNSTRKIGGVAADSFASRAGAGAPSGLGRAGLGKEQPTSSDELGECERVSPPALAVVHPGTYELSRGQIAASVGGLVGAWNRIVAIKRPFVPVPESVAEHHDVHAALGRQSDINWWAEVCEGVAGSDFLSGRVALADGRTFVADFWWVLTNAEKIHAGRYSNREAVAPIAPLTKADHRRAKLAAASAEVLASYANETEPVS